MPKDPVFDVDTALAHKERPVNPESVMALSETAKALEKDLKKFQNYYGFNNDNDQLHNAKKIEKTGDSRFQISRPRPKSPKPKAKFTIKKIKAAEYMSVLPSGPSSMMSEIQGLLTTEVGNKRMRITPDKRVPYIKKMSVKNSPNSFSKYHRAPVVRNENKVLPFGPHAYFQSSNVPQAPSEFVRGLPKSSFPKKPNMLQIYGPSVFAQHPERATQKSNVEKNRLDPRWFTWTKGLATTNGVTTTNTHSNSNQNEPGSVTMSNHVTSSQQAKGATEVKQMYNLPKDILMNNANIKYLILNPSPVSQNALSDLQNANLRRPMAPVTTNANTRLLQAQRLRKIAATNRVQADRIRYAATQKQAILKAQKTRDMLMQRNAALLNRQNTMWMKRNQRGQQKQSAPAIQKDDVHTTEHKHQWGFGNGNGHGNGVGTPGASGSGGGWGAGGPLSSNVNFPGWGSSPAPSQNRFIAQLARKGPFPPITREMWNSFLAQKRQSNSNMKVETENTAQSSVEIHPANGIQNGKVTAHQWGFGNGQGQGQGQGSPGGTGNGGGWGAGGPTKQNTWLPNQRSAIHSSTLSNAIAQSFTAPWLPQSNQKFNNMYILSSQPDLRGRIPPMPPQTLNLLEIQRSHIPSPTISKQKPIPNSLNIDPHNKRPYAKARIPPRIPLARSQPLSQANQIKIRNRLPSEKRFLISSPLRTRKTPIVQRKQSYNLNDKRGPQIQSNNIAMQNYRRLLATNPLLKNMNTQDIFEALPFLKRK